jgi:glycosyltransferase involved in cell wall biosynthesis
MKIAFYAPLKPPDHPVPSGDRLMARQLIAALTLAGHDVHVASTLRAFTPQPDTSAFVKLRSGAEAEIARITAQWRTHGKPDLWFSYHPYYKAPDLLAAALAREFGIALITAEASYSARRNRQGWSVQQDHVADLVRQARINLCFTERDAKGLRDAVPQARIMRIEPFIDTARFRTAPATMNEPRLLAIAMLRKGDKSESFAMLAAALEKLLDIDWRLTIIGDGPAAATVKAMFAAIPATRIDWKGEIGAEAIAKELANAALYVWPGCGEAYGLAYLEAQAAGLPVIAQNTAGVPAVVIDGETGLLTPGGDIDAFANAVRRLIASPEERRRLSHNARKFVLGERSLETAAPRLAAILAEHVP